MSAAPDDLGERWAEELRQLADAGPDRSDLSWMTDDPDRPQMLNWTALEGHDPPPRFWHLPEWLGDDPCLFSGRGGAGKTLIAQAVATSLSIGLEYFTAAPTKPVNVLMWACEDSADELLRRQLDICQHFGVRLADLAGRLHIEARRGLDNTLFATAFGAPVFTGLRDELAEQIRDYRASVVILDNIGQVFGGNENDRHHVTSFVNGLYGIGARAVQHFTPVLLGHVSRSQGSEFAGNLAWENACRMRWYLGNTLPDQEPEDEDEPPDPDVVFLAKRKSNYSSRDFVKLTYRKGLMVPAGIAVADYDPGAETAEQVVLAAFDTITTAGIAPTDGRTSPDYLPTVIKRMDLSRTFTKRELAAAMGRLMGQGKLRRTQVGQYPNRNPKFRLVRS